MTLLDPTRPTAAGLALFAVVPTTLGVGVALVTASKGNQALALLLTVGTNLLGILTVPFMLRAVLSGSGNVSVQPADLVIKLLYTVLVPTIVGKVSPHGEVKVIWTLCSLRAYRGSK